MVCCQGAEATERGTIREIKVDVAIAARSASWIFSVWQALEGKPEIAVNGFKKAGIPSA